MNNRHKGLTLIEVLISVALLSVGIVIILQTFVRSAQTLAYVRDDATAYAFAVVKLADLEIAWQRGETFKTRGEFTADGQRYRWFLTSAPLDVPELEHVTLNVTWRHGPQQHVSQMDLVRRLPPQEDAS